MDVFVCENYYVMLVSVGNNFFKSFEGSSTITHNKEDLEVLNYFQDTSKNLSCLLRYPYVLSVFKHYSTVLPSTAPVERLFPFSGMIDNS